MCYLTFYHPTLPGQKKYFKNKFIWAHFGAKEGITPSGVSWDKETILISLRSYNPYECAIWHSFIPHYLARRNSFLKNNLGPILGPGVSWDKETISFFLRSYNPYKYAIWHWYTQIATYKFILFSYRVSHMMMDCPISSLTFSQRKKRKPSSTRKWKKFAKRMKLCNGDMLWVGSFFYENANPLNMLLINFDFKLNLY